MRISSACVVASLVLVLVACDTEPPGPLAGGRFPGPADAPLYDHLPLVAPPAIRAGELDPRESYGGMSISDRLILARFREDASVGDANAVLDRHGLRVVASSPLGAVVLEMTPPDVDALFAMASALEAEAIVEAAAPDVLMGLDSVAPTDRAGWEWTATPAGENMRLEMIRAPQAFSLLDHLVTSEVEVGVLDGGFGAHPELGERLNVLPVMGGHDPGSADGRRQFDHGMNVACVIGAAHDDRTGVAGMAPFVRIHGVGTEVADNLLLSRSHMGAIGRLSDLFYGQTRTVLDLRTRVVNVSQGYVWRTAANDAALDPYDAATYPWVEGLVARHGSIARRDIERANLDPDRPVLFVVSAGNDGARADGAIRPDFSARLNSPWTWAALHPVVDDPMRPARSRHILVVENVGGVNTDSEHGIAVEVPPTRRYAGGIWVTSLGGHVSAPGRAVYSCGYEGYVSMHGTSQSAPHVTGLAALLVGLEPTLSNEELRVLLRGNTTWNAPLDPAFAVEIPSVMPAVPTPPLPRPAAMIDAFGAALSIDRLPGREGRRMQIALVDTDDGTADGNQRLSRRADGSIRERNASDRVVDGRLVRGDHVVDMRDFRRLRDALVLVRGDGDDLDGASDAQKRDLDDDGSARPAAEEAIYARFDFNGDGTLDASSRIDFPGLWASGGTDATLRTDIAVLQEVWGLRSPRADTSELPDTEGWIAADLPFLIDSVDIEVHLDGFFAEHRGDPTPVERVEVRYRSRSASFPADSEGRSIEAGATREVVRGESETLVMTVPLLPDVYIEIEPRSGAGTPVDIQNIPLLFADVDAAPVDALTTVRSYDLPPLRAGNDLWLRFGRVPDPPELRIAYVVVDSSRPETTGIHSVLANGSDPRALLVGLGEARNGGAIACQRGGEYIWFVSSADFDNVYRVRTDGTESTRITSATSSTGYGSVDVSADGATLVMTREGNVVRLDLATLAVTPLTTDGGWTNPRFSPDGRTVYATRGSRIYSIPPTGGASTPLTPDMVQVDLGGGTLIDLPVQTSDPAVAPASGRIAFVTNYGTVHEIPAPATTSAAELYWIDPSAPSTFVEITGESGLGFSKLTPSWSPDEATLAFTGTEISSTAVSLYVVSASGGAIRRIGPEPTAHAFSPCWIDAR